MQSGWKVVEVNVSTLLAPLRTVYDGPDANLYAGVLDWFDKAADQLQKTAMAHADEAIAVLREAKLPTMLAGINKAQKNCLHALVQGKVLLAKKKAALPEIYAAILALGSQAHADNDTRPLG